jgi:hypothetical protein
MDRRPLTGLHSAMAKRTIEPGQRYRDVRPGIFGRRAHSEWIVEAVEMDALGIAHARLINGTDLTARKTLAAGVLTDSSRFEEV